MINKLSNYTLVVLVAYWLAYQVGYGLIYKHYEPQIDPVVTDFRVDYIQRDEASLYISGTMYKRRGNCVFDSLTVYDNAVKPKRLLDLEFLDTPNQNQNRDEGLQAYGAWRITPHTKNIELSVTHMCPTGIVVTSLYNGSI